MKQKYDRVNKAGTAPVSFVIAAAILFAAIIFFSTAGGSSAQDEGGRKASDRPSQKKTAANGANEKAPGGRADRNAATAAQNAAKKENEKTGAATSEVVLKDAGAKDAAVKKTEEILIAKPAAPKEKPKIDSGETSESVVKKPKKQPITITGDLFEMEPDDTYVVTGNVKVFENDRILTCARGTYNEKTGITQALTNVDVVDRKFKMKCQRVDSHMKENFSIFSGGVMIVGENFTAQAEKAHYYEKEEKMILLGNPMAKSKDEVPNEVHGERIIYYMKTERSEVIGNVAAILNPKKNDPKGSITHITGNKLEILEDGTYQVLDNLRVIKKDMILYADRGLYNETSEITEAYGNVKVETSKYTMTSGYIKNMAKEDRTIANIKPKLVQIVNKKDRKTKKAGDDKKANGDKKSPEETASETKPDEKDKTAGAENEGDKKTDDKKAGKEKKKISNKDKVVLEANEIEALNNSSHIVARGKAYMIQYPYLGGEGTEDVDISSTVQAEIMDIFTEEGKMIAKENVVLTTKDITAYGDNATYYEDEEKLDIEGNARAIQKRGKGLEDNDIVGEKITYFTGTERVLVTRPKIKFFQTKKEEGLPEIEKDTKPVRLKRRKAEATTEVAVANTGEVSLGKTTSETVLKNAGTGEVKLVVPASNATTAATSATTAPGGTSARPQPPDAGTGQGTRPPRAPSAAPAPEPKVKLMIAPSGKVKVKTR